MGQIKEAAAIPKSAIKTGRLGMASARQSSLRGIRALTRRGTADSGACLIIASVKSRTAGRLGAARVVIYKIASAVAEIAGG